jgi:tetratricopeptide (TPR) repeat protein
MIYFTLSNIGLCMEMLNKIDDAYLMFKEQYEISKLIKNLKFKANALLKLINLCLNRTNLTKNELQNELIQMLKELFTIYSQLNDVNGQLFTSQSLAYCFHTNGNLKQAIKYYSHNIELCKSNSSNLCNEMLKKSVFNLSLCYKMKCDFKKALDFQMQYLELINENDLEEQYRQNNYLKFKSLGIIADLMFEIDKNEENCQQCIDLNIERLRIIKNLPNKSIAGKTILKSLIEKDLLESIEINPNLNDNSKDNNESILKLINDCLESIAKYYNHLENYQQVLKFKLIQLEIKKEMENESVNDTSELIEIMKEKLKIWFEIGSLFLFKFEDTNESYTYFHLIIESLNQNKDFLLESLTLGNMGTCKQKNGEYEKAIEHFKNQLVVLAKRFNSLNLNLIVKLEITNENLSSIREIISIRIDMSRSLSQLSKCFELMSLQTNNSIYSSTESNEYLTESLNYLNEYYKECEYLYETFVKQFLEIIKNKNNQEEESSDEDDLDLNNSQLKNVLKDLCEHIFIDYDQSLAKLSHFYAAYTQNEKKILKV